MAPTLGPPVPAGGRWFTADDETMIHLKGEVDEELRPFRSTMTAAQLAMLEQQMWRRKLLERFDVPRLSLFYLL